MSEPTKPRCSCGHLASCHHYVTGQPHPKGSCVECALKKLSMCLAYSPVEPTKPEPGEQTVLCMCCKEACLSISAFTTSKWCDRCFLALLADPMHACQPAPAEPAGVATASDYVCKWCNVRMEKGSGGLWYADGTGSTCYQNPHGGGHDRDPGCEALPSAPAAPLGDARVEAAAEGIRQRSELSDLSPCGDHRCGKEIDRLSAASLKNKEIASALLDDIAALQSELAEAREKLAGAEKDLARALDSSNDGFQHGLSVGQSNLLDLIDKYHPYWLIIHNQELRTAALREAIKAICPRCAAGEPVGTPLGYKGLKHVFGRCNASAIRSLIPSDTGKP